MLAFMKFGLFAACLLLLAALPGSARAQATAHTPRAPVVVELYTSQGCAQCVRANRLLGEFSREPGLIALTFPVGYWDYLGWVDTFAQPEFEDRQRAFSRALRRRAPYTPQLIVDGLRQVSADDWDESRSALMEVQATPLPAGTPSVTIHRLANDQVRVNVGAGAAQQQAADIWLIAYDPGPIHVRIRAGENMGRTIAHYNLVRRVTRVGSWGGQATWFERPRCTPQCAVVVQAPRGGRILAAAMTRPPQTASASR